MADLHLCDGRYVRIVREPDWGDGVGAYIWPKDREVLPRWQWFNDIKRAIASFTHPGFCHRGLDGCRFSRTVA